MASSKNATQIQWSAANSVTVSSATVVWSDAFTLNAEDWQAELQVDANNAGTPASGDTCDVYVAYSTGDILGDSGDDFASVEHSEFLFRLDTFGTNTPGEDPANRSAPVRCGAKAFKVGVSCAQAATRNIVVRAMVNTHRPQ